MNKIILPQLEIRQEHMAAESVVFVGGGRAPNVSWFQQMARDRKVIAIDRGADICARAKILPEALIGDGDSATATSWTWCASNQADIVKLPRDKDLTDTQYAMERYRNLRKNLICTGLWGGRFDHLYANIFSARGYLQDYPLIIFADEQEILVLSSKMDASFAWTEENKPEVISLLPLSEHVSEICIDHVKWPLHDAEFMLNQPYAISNEPLANKVQVSCQWGTLGVYFSYNK